ncbi:DUF1338 domain-containing protein [Thalassotalea atypica]|uniref:DUF1338 domain-containing protein n=1 Tax=Thalassotalea atypica TaxID=2054316 RepID=UPI00257268D2|nr:DUF1338 domain-containing protein [Thalassotalea atypica]
MTAQITSLFENIWQNYLEVTPSAEKVHQLLGSGTDVINDHVAYRTFNIASVNLDKLAQHLLNLGYKECGEYHFEAKCLYAKHFEHQDTTLPKVFISELLVEKFSPQVQSIVTKLVEQMDEGAAEQENFLYSGKHWSISFEDYKTLLAESEYAAWLSAWGFRANHFTVSINHLENYTCINAVNDAVKDGGFALNTVGGEVKGDETVKLEQSSTMADLSPVEFSDGIKEIPSCFYEFALRYPLANGELYSGFVAASADKIFESTNAA